MTENENAMTTDFSKECNIVALGRNGKACITVWRSDVNKPAYNATMSYKNPYATRNVVLNMITSAIIETVKSGFNGGVFRLYTLDTVAIKGYQYNKLKKNPDFQIEDLDSKLDIPDKQLEEDRKIYTDMVAAIKYAEANGCAVIFNSFMNTRFFDLEVPDNVTLEEGQLLSFKNGATEDGVKIIGYNSFNGANHAVHVVARKKGKTRYYVSRNASGRELSEKMLSLSKVVADDWNKLPRRDVTVESGTLAELGAA